MVPAHSHELLRVMAANSGHLEIGGKAVHKYDPRGMQFEHEVIGRTRWIGQPEWARSCGMTSAQIIAAVEKAITGKRKLCKRQALLIEGMLFEIEATRANLAQAIIVVQALDGRWTYGPECLKAAMESEDFWDYPTKEAAQHVAAAESEAA
jgi:hypothetical protein